MVNKFFELDRLRSHLSARGIDSNTIEQIVSKADQEIEQAMASKMQEALQQAVTLGVQKNSVDFINDVRPSPGAYAIETASGNTDFSEPPFPMLPSLLRNAKPMKDGSGVYKVIPIGSKNTEKPSMARNIFDAQKAIMADRAETAKRQYNKVMPSGSPTQFRTVTSKQNASTSWVKPAKTVDFTDDLKEINISLEDDLLAAIEAVINDYKENF